MIEAAIQELANKIRLKYALSDNYELILSNEVPGDVHIRMYAGWKPKIVLNRIWVMNEIAANQIHHVRSGIQRALEKIPRMTYSLGALMPLSMALELRENQRKWYRLKVCNPIRSGFSAKYFVTTYSVTVTDSLTGSSITLNGDNLAELEKEAMVKLSRIIINDLEQMEIREMLEERERLKSIEQKPNSVDIHIGNEIIETRNY